MKVGKKNFYTFILVPKTEVTPADAPTPEKPLTPSDPPPRLKGWGRLRGDKAPAPAPPQLNPPPKIETVQPVIVEKKPFTSTEVSAKDTSSTLKAASASSASLVAKSPAEASHSGPDYAHLNDRLNRIEQLISDLMVKVDDKTRSIEKSVAKVKAKSKHAKPHSVTICVDSPQGAGTSGASNNDCDEQFL